METQTKPITQEYKDYTDKYFLRARHILENEGINPIVRYQVFARQDIDALRGVDEAVDFIHELAPNVKVYALRDGQEYTAKEPIMKLEGRVQDLMELETVYLGIISGRLTGELDFKAIRQNAREIRQAAEEKPLLYFAARHFGYWDDEQLARICFEEGFQGASTDAGARAWNAKGMGTVPHALVLAINAYMDQNNIRGNPSVEAMNLFDKHIDKEIPRVMLIDTYNREVSDTLEVAREVPNLNAVRIDTCGENYTECSREGTLPRLDVHPKYLYGKGVTIKGVWTLRKLLDKNGLVDLGLVVSSGFNQDKTKAFMHADKVYQWMYAKPLFTAIGTGSIAKPIMTTSDIVAYYNEDTREWKSMSKVGRSEVHSTKLQEVTK